MLYVVCIYLFHLFNIKDINLPLIYFFFLPRYKTILKNSTVVYTSKSTWRSPKNRERSNFVTPQAA